MNGDNLNDSEFDMLLQSAEWAVNQSRDLLEQYKKCRTTRSRQKILARLTPIWQKVKYEEKNINKIIEENGLI